MSANKNTNTRVLNKALNEAYINTKGVFIDTYFVNMRDANESLAKKFPLLIKAKVTHTDEKSVSTLITEDVILHYTLYKVKIGGKLQASALTLSAEHISDRAKEVVKKKKSKKQ